MSEAMLEEIKSIKSILCMEDSRCKYQISRVDLQTQRSQHPKNFHGRVRAERRLPTEVQTAFEDENLHLMNHWLNTLPGLVQVKKESLPTEVQTAFEDENLHLMNYWLNTLPGLVQVKKESPC